MQILKPFGATPRFRPWNSLRHRSRYGLMETLRREFGGDPTLPLGEVMDDLAPAARREIRRRMGGLA